MRTGTVIETSSTGREEWAGRGVGPGGIADRVPFLGLHWYSHHHPLTATCSHPTTALTATRSTNHHTPMHRYVQSLASSVAYKITRPGKATIEGTGLAHQEKNWGKSTRAL